MVALAIQLAHSGNDGEQPGGKGALFFSGARLKALAQRVDTVFFSMGPGESFWRFEAAADAASSARPRDCACSVGPIAGPPGTHFTDRRGAMLSFFVRERRFEEKREGTLRFA